MQKPNYFKMKHDDGKERWDLLNFSIIRTIVIVLTFGAKKYTANSWQGVPDGESRYRAAFLRHWEAYCRGEYLALDSKLPHLWHAFCNLYFLIWFEGRREVKRRYYYKQKRS